MRNRKSSTVAGGWICLFLLAGGCTIHRLPVPPVADCAGTSVSDFWKCVDRDPVPAVRESGFISSVRAASVVRKRRDQDERAACGGRTPPGYQRLTDIQMPPDRAPLHALWSEPTASAPIVLVVHGMYDSKFSKYIRVTSDLLRAEGFGVLAPDMRWHGCLLSPKWLPTLGIEEGRDLVAWVRWIRKEHPGHPVGLIGFSLGGLSVLHAAGEPEASEVFDAGVVAISPAGALARTADDLDSPAFVYDRGLTFALRAVFRSYLRHRIEKLGISPVSGSFLSFLDWLARHGLFPPGTTRDDLLRMANPAPVAALTRRPVLVLASRNDPIISPEAAADLARASAENPYLHVIETPFGGHIGQIGLFPEWTAKALVTFFRYSSAVPPRI